MKVSHILLTYNQERYVREALESLLAQTYQDVEVVVSDDCSTDKTWQVVEQVASEYRGTKKVILNRNENNLGLVANYNRATLRCSGEVLVSSAGDDVSLPHRVEQIVDAFMANPDTSLVYSNCIKIDEDSKSGELFYPLDYQPLNGLWYLWKTREFGVLGAVIAVSRKVFDSFGALPPFALMEDCSLVIRAKFVGNIRYICSPLVLYRVHKNNYSIIMRDRSMRKKQLNYQSNSVECLVHDAMMCKRVDILPPLLMYRLALSIERRVIERKVSAIAALTPFSVLAGRHQTKKYISRYIFNRKK